MGECWPGCHITEASLGSADLILPLKLRFRVLWTTVGTARALTLTISSSASPCSLRTVLGTLPSHSRVTSRFCHCRNCSSSRMCCNRHTTAFRARSAMKAMLFATGCSAADDGLRTAHARTQNILTCRPGLLCTSCPPSHKDAWETQQTAANDPRACVTTVADDALPLRQACFPLSSAAHDLRRFDPQLSICNHLFILSQHGVWTAHTPRWSGGRASRCTRGESFGTATRRHPLCPSAGTGPAAHTCCDGRGGA